MAKPFAARVWPGISLPTVIHKAKAPQGKNLAYNDTVIGCEYCQLIKSGHEVPTRSDVAKKKDAKGEDGEGVHELTLENTCII